MRDDSHLSGSAVRARSGRHGRLVGVNGPWVKVGWDVDGEILPREESYLRSDPYVDEEVEILSMQGWQPLGKLIGAENEMRPRVRDYEAILKDLASLESLEMTAKPIWESEDPLKQLAVNMKLLAGPEGDDFDAIERLYRLRVERIQRELNESPGGKSHSPFKTAAKTFMGPRSGWFHKFPGAKKGKHMARHHKKDVWDCSSEGAYKQVCVAQKAVPEQGITKGAVKHVSQPAGTKSKYNKEYKAFQAASHGKASRSRLLKQMKHKERMKAKLKAAQAKKKKK